MFRTLLLFIFFSSSTSFAQSEGWAISNSGVNLYFKIIGSGSPLLVVGDAGNSSAYMMGLINKLAENHRVIYFDTRATGKSRLPVLNDSTVNFQKAIADIEGLRAVIRVQKWSIVGHGFGAVVASAYSAHYPQNVEQLLLINPAAIHLKHRNYDPYTDIFEDYDFSPMLTPEAITKRFDSLQKSLNIQHNSKDTLARWQLINAFQSATYVYDTINAPLATIFLQERTKNVLAKQYLRENWEMRHLAILRQYKGAVMVVISKPRRTYKEVMQSWRDSLQNCKMLSIEKAYHFPWADNPVGFYPEIELFLSHHQNNLLLATTNGNKKTERRTKISRIVGRGYQRGKRT